MAAEQASALERELDRELCDTHALVRSTRRAVTKRTDCDDVLFVVDGTRWAIVHLTWTVESDPRWPPTTFLPDLRSFERLRTDHEALA